MLAYIIRQLITPLTYYWLLSYWPHITPLLIIDYMAIADILRHYIIHSYFFDINITITFSYDNDYINYAFSFKPLILLLITLRHYYIIITPFSTFWHCWYYIIDITLIDCILFIALLLLLPLHYALYWLFHYWYITTLLLLHYIVIITPLLLIRHYTLHYILHFIRPLHTLFHIAISWCHAITSHCHYISHWCHIDTLLLFAYASCFHYMPLLRHYADTLILH